jgi:hypothetical protein
VNIVYVYADTSDERISAEWRCSIPARAFQRSGLHTAQLLDIDSFAQDTPEAHHICQNADVMIVQRDLFGPVLNAIQRWKSRDKLVIADFDDALQLMPDTASDYEFWNSGKRSDRKSEGGDIAPPPLTQFKWGLRLVHAVTVPSEQLATDWSEFAQVYKLPNYMEIEHYLESPPRTHEGIIIGWSGDPTHPLNYTDSGVVTALQNVCKARPNVRVMICGDERVYQLLSVPPQQKIFQPLVPYKEWPQQLAYFDVGISPLTTPYDQRQSWIKVMEFMAMKIPWIATDGPAYHSLGSYGWLVQNKANAWERILLDMVDNLAGHKAEAASEPFIFSLSQSIDQNIDKILALFQMIRSKNFVKGMN